MKFDAQRVRAATKDREPCFDNLKKIFKGEKPSRPTLFEFYLNGELEEDLCGRKFEWIDSDNYFKDRIEAFRIAGYDYVTISASDMGFVPDTKKEGKQTKSLNDASWIADWESFEKFEWPDPVAAYNGRPEKLAKYLPEGMVFNVCGPNGVLENVIGLTGYENLCYMIIDEPDLVKAIFDKVGGILFDYYKQIITVDSVGMIISNDDWGFNTQTLLSVDAMQEYVFPWHRKFIEMAHAEGKPVVLHSCGNMDQIIEFFGPDNLLAFDGKHSYEDNIKPVEQAYGEYKERFAVMGGLDLDFVVRHTPEEVYERALKMVELSNGCERFGLGTGNSVPPYVPNENYYAMILAAIEQK